MNFLFEAILILILIIFILFFCFLSKIIKIYNKLDYQKYKINFILVSWFYLVIYLLIFIIIFYLFRYFRLGEIINVKSILHYILFLKNIIFALPFFYEIYVIILGIVILLSFFFVFYIIKQYLMLNLFSLFIFYKKYRLKYTQYINKLKEIGENDIISYLLKEMIYKTTKYYYGKEYSYDKLPKYHPYRFISKIYTKKYQFFISTLPVSFFMIECLLNDYKIQYFFYFIMVYFPIILFKIFTSFLCKTPSFILDILWDIYYNNDEKNLIYAISQETKSIFDLYFLNNMARYDFMDAEFQLNLDLIIRFPLIYADRKSYMNDITTLTLVYDSSLTCYKVFEEIEIINELGEISYKLGKEWIFLAKK